MSSPSVTPLGAARQREHGQILVLFAFVLISLLLISALAIDYGGWLLARRTYQNVADEAALAGSYQLTSPTGADCAQAAGISKQTCAREAAWTAIQNHIGLPSGKTPATLGDTAADSVNSGPGVSWDDWTVWVASPPSDAGSYYTGLASSNKTVFVRIERRLQAGLSRIIQSGTTIGAWATAGRIPENFAIITLCQSGCLGQNADLQVAGTGSNLILESGDLGSNSWGKTSGNSASIALCTGGATTSQCSAYMHTASQCSVTSTVCQLDAWNGTTVDTSTRYSALALPQVVDPKYTVPTLSDTTNRTTGVVGGTAPEQCYSILDSTAPAVSMADGAQQYAVNDPFGLAAAQLPPTPAPVTLGAVTLSGTVTAFSGGAAIANATVKFTPSSGPAKSGTTNASGAYSINGVGSGTYSITVTDPSGVYQTYTESGFTVGSSDLTKNIAMHKNPSFTGTVQDAATFTPISPATVQAIGPGGTFTATWVGNTYTVYVTGVAGSYTLTGSATNYTSQSYSQTSGALDSAPITQNFSLSHVTGTLQGTVTDSSTSLPIANASVLIDGTTTVTTNSSGFYTTGVNTGSHTVQASATGYTSSSTVTVTVASSPATTQNFSLTPNSSSVTGTVYDQTTGLKLSGVVVAASNGVSSGSATTNASGVYTISGLTPSNPKYTLTATISGWTTQTLNNKSLANGPNTIDFAATAGNGLWPANCGTNGANKGTWSCDNGTGCTTVTNPTAINVGCSAYNDTNRIRPGTYKSITIGNNECAWIDPLGGVPGLTSGQSGGIVYVTDTISIGSSAFLLGDGVTIVLGTGAHVDVGNSGGFALNYGGSSCPFPDPGTCSWRTAAYIGNNTGTATWSYCNGGTGGTDTDSRADLRKGAFTTGGTSQVARLTWITSGGSTCYQDGDTGSYLSSAKGEIGMTWYLRGSPTCCGGHRFSFSGEMGFLFDGVLYGPNDDIDLGGQGAQAAAGQIVAYTLKFHGDTDIHQRYGGLEIDGPPYLIEPYIGE